MLALLGLNYEKVPVHRTGKGRNELPGYIDIPAYDGAGGALVE